MSGRETCASRPDAVFIIIPLQGSSLRENLPDFTVSLSQRPTNIICASGINNIGWTLDAVFVFSVSCQINKIFECLVNLSRSFMARSHARDPAGRDPHLGGS